MNDLAPLDRLGGFFSVLVAQGVAGALLLGWVFVLLGLGMRALVRARALLAAVTDPKRLRAGPALLQGTVRVEGGPAATVTVHQRGVLKRYKNHQELHWTEFRREQQVREFSLELSTGQRVRVEPGSRVELVDLLGAPEPAPHARKHVRERLRRATVDDGEAVFVRGNLEGSGRVSLAGGYRSAESLGWALRPDHGGLFISSEPVADPLARRSIAHLTWSLLGVLAALWLQLGVLGEYRELHARGEPVEMTVSAGWDHYQREGYGRRARYFLVLVSASGDTHRVEVNRDAWSRTYPGQAVPVTVSRADPRLVQVGHGPAGLRYADATVVLLTVAFLALGHWLTLRASRRWYEQPRVIDREPPQEL
ncbi:MAG: hypothetical protein HY909_00385 [Deltaproteobacteria bacterium]|nr:hypothetical protein [Deltaproteobacteria bacterium]